MDGARTAVSIMGLEDKETKHSSPKANLRKAIRILAKTPTALAAFYRLRKGKKIIAPKKNLTFSENFFHMPGDSHTLPRPERAQEAQLNQGQVRQPKRMLRHRRARLLRFEM